MRRKWIAPAALVVVLLVPSSGWAPPPVFRPPPPAPRPTPPVRPPTLTPARSPGSTYRPPPPAYRPPLVVLIPNFHSQYEEARRRNAAEAADLLRRQNAAIGRAERAAMLNELAHEMLRQKQSASLVQLRQLRADWVAVGAGAGLDPIIAMQLEAAESAAERLLLADVLQLVRDGRFADARARVEALDASRYLPAAVVQALPDLRAGLNAVVPFARMQTELRRPQPSFRAVWEPASDVPQKQLPAAVARPVASWSALDAVRAVFDTAGPVADIERAIARVSDTAGAEVARKLRVELAARLYLLGRAGDAAKLLEGEVDSAHAGAVLADLRAVVLGRGEILTPQVAAFVPADQPAPPAQAVALLPPAQLAAWKPPARKPGETTVGAATADARRALTAAVDVEVTANTTKVTTAADRIRAVLAVEAAPLKAFLDKVEAARGKPFSAPAERQLAAIAGSRGMTVAEVLGVLAVEADRPASAARLLATVPVFGDAGTFAVAVEVSGRAPAGFAAHPDAGFKLAPARDRARIREAVGAVLHAQAGNIVSGREPAPLDRTQLEAEVRNRLGLTAETVLAPGEYVQALLDVCRDGADAHARLADAMRELGAVPTDYDESLLAPDEVKEVKELISAVKLRRLSVQVDKKRREAGLEIGCQLLGGYGAEGAPAREWLAAQVGDQPWRATAAAALEKIGAK